MMNLTFGSGGLTTGGNATARLMHQSLLMRVSPIKMETDGDHNHNKKRINVKKVSDGSINQQSNDIGAS
jgi:hypothetical protein